MQYIDPSYLNDLLSQYQESYATAEPFPHVVIDNFLPEAILNNVLDEFPSPDSIEWQTFNAAPEKKLASKTELQMGPETRFLLYQLNSSVFINFLEQMTGITGLIADPHFDGGGLHQIQRGGYLKMHVDFSRNSRLKLDRRLNLLIYLNKDWKEEYGGHLELWDKKVTQCKKRILPIFNRCVIFTTNDFSYHGHPDPLTCPEDRTRKSLALYYYSNGRPASDLNKAPHSTIFQARPGEHLPQVQEPIFSPKKLARKLLAAIPNSKK